MRRDFKNTRTDTALAFQKEEKICVFWLFYLSSNIRRKIIFFSTFSSILFSFSFYPYPFEKYGSVADFMSNSACLTKINDWTMNE